MTFLDAGIQPIAALDLPPTDPAEGLADYSAATAVRRPSRHPWDQRSDDRRRWRDRIGAFDGALLNVAPGHGAWK
jgi:hypothetical protein